MGASNSKESKDTFILSYSNGDKYEGEITSGVRDGYGTYFYHNGDKYEGWWQNNKKHGMGTLYYKDGNLYVGQWKNSEKEGMGTLYFRNGEKYYGEFRRGKKNGRGFFFSHDGNKYFGTFKDNKKHGKGIMYYSKGKICKEIWDSGVLLDAKFLNESKTIEGDSNKISQDNTSWHQVDQSFDNYIEDQIKYLQNPSQHSSNKIKSKFFTLEVAKYFKARIPNNYFDAIQIVTMTSDLLYDNPRVTEWSEDDIIAWFDRIGIEKYNCTIRENGINGMRFIKMSILELRQAGIDDLRDIKLILKSIDFLRIFVKLQLDYKEILENPPENVNIIEGENHSGFHLSSSHFFLKGDRDNKFHHSSTNLPHSHLANTMTSSHTANANLFHVKSDNNLTENIKNDETREDIIESIEYVITKMAITKLLMHSLNLSGFNFFINYNELKFVHKIGEGGFGQVYLGLWNGKYVAIKKFNTKEKYHVKQALNKFIKEINIISNLRHPNIILYIGASIHKNEYFMISEYIPKGSLFDYLHVKKMKLADNEQLNIAYETAIAIRYLHSRNITHCDMKSSNILLDENLKIKVSDFGLSRLVNLFAMNENKGRIGTSHWMPPEIMKAQKYLEASDVFSYGMILWEIVTGDIPYCGLTPNQIMGLVTDCKKIVEVPKEGHIALRKLIKNCLIYESEKRPSFDQIIKYLDEVIQKDLNHDFLSEEIAQFIN